ncbi:invasion associated locus B family protein [Parvibaculum sp.]|uniref:invasion associated locus B family protein n=1 Tax=Parvibaculum sp. TaxID=2024848 RepID=UPI00320D6E84
MLFSCRAVAAASALFFLLSAAVANAEVGVLNDPPPAPPAAKAEAPKPAKKPAAKKPAAKKVAAQSKKPLHVESFGDWKVVCPTKEKKSCFARILLVDQEKRQPAVSWFVAQRADGKGAMSFLNVPLGVLLPAGVTVEVKDKPRKYPFTRCTPQGCNALFPMDPDLVSRLSTMNTVSVTVIGPNTRALAYTVSLKGFGDAMKRIE